MHSVNGIDRRARPSPGCDTLLDPASGPLPSGASWHAELALRIEMRGTASVLCHARHEGPLRVQRPFYPEGPGVCHIYVLHPPGGIAPGDELCLDIGIGTGSRALVTTPAATKVYRTHGPRSIQKQVLRVSSGASLEWFPQETIVFDGARFDTETLVLLEKGATFVGWEVTCLGRPAMAERFTKGRLRSSFALYADGDPLYIERAIVDGGSEVLSANHGLLGHAAYGTMVVAGALSNGLELVRKLLPGPSSSELVSATLLRGGEVLCIRYIGSDASRGREWFAAIWDALRPRLLSRTSSRPRIWST
jgi:urease accessory protein